MAVVPGWVAADCAGFRAGAESVVPATALIARRKSPWLTCLLRLSRAGGAALLAARTRPSRNEEKQGDCQAIALPYASLQSPLPKERLRVGYWIVQGLYHYTIEETVEL